MAQTIISYWDPTSLTLSDVPAQLLAAKEGRCMSSSAGDNGRTSRSSGSCRNGVLRGSRSDMFSGVMGRRCYSPLVVFDSA